MIRSARVKLGLQFVLEALYSAYMLDIKRLRDEPDVIKERLQTRSADSTIVDEILELDQDRRKKISRVEELKAERNTISKEVGARKSKGESADDLLSGMKEKSDLITQLDQEANEVDAKQKALLLTIPNPPHPDCPIGATADENPEVSRWGDKKDFSFQAKDHVALCETHQLVDFEAAAKISGSGYAVYKGAGAKLERALIQFLLDLHTGDHGYTELSPPFLIREECMVGTGQLPKFREDMYGLDGDQAFLAPTAEVPVTNLHREEMLKSDDLPIQYAAYTPCFRREAGSAGKETKGLTRMHQFDKVELVQIVHPSQSYEVLENIRTHAQTVLEKLGLHYRTIELCTGDLGFGAAKCYDIEVWAPGAESYLEVSSCSNFLDFQARRMNLRFKGVTPEEKKPQFCHTLNGSGTALPRLFIALIETYQQEDGSILIPDALQPYFHADR
ncbi:MAG: serine--tRNA ligase, partial [Verrucomicrobiota bacterium]